ncbi:MAG: NAD(P)-dependent alcohol dehydrogenase [Promethearchaeota archaeon]
MKAIVWTKYGAPEGLQLREVKKPVPKDNEVLIRICATTVFAGDTELRSLKFPFLMAFFMRLYLGSIKPKRITILGQELAGEIEAVGKDVELFKIGDQVFAHAGFGMSTYAEYICLREEGKNFGGILAIKPTNMTYEEAAAVPTGGLEALHFLRKANIQKGQMILINGAGGSIGTYAVQLAKYFGAIVTAVDSTKKLDMLLSIGADSVIDYTKEDFTKMDEIDVILDIVGKLSFSDCIKMLKQNGYYLIANPRRSHEIRGRRTSRRSSKKIITEGASHRTEDLIFLKELIEAEKIKTIIDRTYPLDQMVEAHKYVDSGHKKGNVVITVEQSKKI